MRDCPNAEIRDLLPDFVHRTLGDGEMARVTAHVASCADCRAEVALLRSAAGVLRTRPRVNVAAIVRALPAPPAAPARLVLEGAERTVQRPLGAPARRRAARWAGVAAAAAAVIAVVTLREPGTTGEQSSRAAAAVDTARPAIRSLPSAVAEARDSTAARSTGATVASAPTQVAMSLAGGPADLTDGELEALLGALETMDAMPSAEPEEPIGPLREGGEDSR